MNLIALLFVFNGMIIAEGGPGDFSFANIYSSNMVLQKAPARAKIWGYAEEIGRWVIITFQDIIYEVPTLIGQDGNVTWSVLLSPTQPGGPYDITATLGKKRIQLTNVLFGDIWFCSGQSNMAYSVGALDSPERELVNAQKYPNIRLFQAAFSYSSELQSEAHVARSWEQPSRESVKKFSAVCWLFGRKLYRHLGYPIGLIKAAYPGSRIEAWMSTKTLAKCFPEGVNEWTRAEDYAHNQPSVLWNAMVNPFLPLSIKGAIWYQGEWNRNNSGDYDCALSNMVADWREAWFTKSGRTMDKIFPFGQVQLAPWRLPNNSDSDLSFPAVRWAQTLNLGYTPNKALPKVFTAVAMDLPDFDSPYGDIHPRYKRPIADRLVLGALNEAYDWTVTHQGPLPSEFMLEQIGFLHVIYNSSTGLAFRNFNNEVLFEICCSLTVNECSLLDNANWFPAEIVDTERADVTLAVPCTTAASVAAIRYAWRESPCPHGIENCTIYSEKSESSPLNLPAPPFYTEWENRT